MVRIHGGEHTNIINQNFTTMKKLESGLSIQTIDEVRFSSFNHENSKVNAIDIDFNGLIFERRRIVAPWMDETRWWHQPGIFVDLPKGQRWPSLKGLHFTTLFSLKPLKDAYPATIRPNAGDKRVTPVFLKEDGFWFDENQLYEKPSDIPVIAGMVWRIPILFGDNKLAQMKDDPSKYGWWEVYEKTRTKVAVAPLQLS